jgi:hypothetical protein
MGISFRRGCPVQVTASVRALAGLIAFVGLLAASAPASAGVAPAPSVEIQQVAGLAPDGRSIGVQVLASCPQRWTVAEALVTVSQPGASGQAAFPLVCIGSARVFSVTVSSSSGSFQLGQAQVNASVVISRGRTAQASDAQVVPVQPTVLVELADSARLEPGGGAVVLDVSVACPAGTTGLQSSLVVAQAGQTMGSATYVPVCDGARHTFTVRVQASQGVYRPGVAQAVTFATIDYAGQTFYGIDDDGALELVS